QDRRDCQKEADKEHTALVQTEDDEERNRRREMKAMHRNLQTKDHKGEKKRRACDMEKRLSALTKDQLEDICRSYDIANFSKKNKPELIQLILSHDRRSSILSSLSWFENRQKKKAGTVQGKCACQSEHLATAHGL